MKTEALVERVEAVAGPVVEGMGLELVDVVYAVEHGRQILRVYIDGPDGVTIDDCAGVSRELGTALDVEDVIPARYNLEVSSPGLARALKKEKDFVRFTGRTVKIRTRHAVDGRRNFTGAISGVEQGKVTIVDATGESLAIAIEDIDRANLKPEV